MRGNMNIDTDDSVKDHDYARSSSSSNESIADTSQSNIPSTLAVPYDVSDKENNMIGPKKCIRQN